MTLKICNVRGDGNCYYRCLWKVMRDEPRCVRAVVGIKDNTVTEDQAVTNIRQFVADVLETDANAQTTLRNMWELSGVIDLSEEFPLAARMKRYKQWDTVLKNSCNLIRTTNIMASQLEHSIIKTALDAADIGIIVLSRTEEDGTLADLAEKWIYQLDVILPKIEASRVTILVNEDNIHYKYLKFNGHTITTRAALQSYIAECMESDSDDCDSE